MPLTRWGDILRPHLRNTVRLFSTLSLSLLLTGCDPVDFAPPTTHRACSPSTAPAPVASTGSGTASGSGTAPATITRDTTIFDGPGADAGPLGVRLAGTQFRVHHVVGDRAYVFERGDMHLASWADLADLTMSPSDWEQYRPQRSAAVVGLYPPAAGVLPTQASTTALHAAATFLETFLEENSPGITILVRTGYGSNGTQATVTIPPVPSCPELRDPGPKPPPFDSKRRSAYDKIVQENERRLAAYHQANDQLKQDARTQITALLSLPPATQAKAGDALAQLARDVGQADAPNRRIVLALNPGSESPPSSSNIDLRGMRVSLILHCADDPVTCSAGERQWRQRLAAMGALTIRTLDVTSPALSLAFHTARPELR